MHLLIFLWLPAERSALRNNLKQEDTDVKPRIKREDGARVKMETIKSEPESYAPSKSFRSAVEQLQQSRASYDGRSATLSSESPGPGGVKSEEGLPRGPSNVFITAFHNVRGGEEHEQPAPRKPRSSARSFPTHTLGLLLQPR